VQIRRATAADIDSMMNLDRGTTTASHWSRRQYEALFTANTHESSERLALVVANQSYQDQSDKDQSREVQVHNPGEGIAESLVLAYLIAHRVDTEWELENIVVAERMRRTGVGLLLVKELAERAGRAGGSSISLEVRESNFAARSFYEKCGFAEIGRRKSYYPHPVEDAIIYRRIF
jgi:ribosomal-protein-alanine N-acetyltransferase